MNEKIKFKRIDHFAIAVEDLERALNHYKDVLGLRLVEMRSTEGEKTGMLSAVLDAGEFQIVLVQGTSEKSQVNRYIDNYGQGVQHVAIEVDGIETVSQELNKQGLEFVTDLIFGDGLKQIFSRRDPSSGVMIELIERTSESGFQDNNVNNLFKQLEDKDAY